MKKISKPALKDKKTGVVMEAPSKKWSHDQIEALTLADRQSDRAGSPPPDRQAGIERENADLRRRIVEVADALTAPGRMPRTASAMPQPERV